MFVRTAALAAVAALASVGSAQVVITEASSTASSGAVGSDWIELTNLGGAPVDITGWRLDDNSNSFASSVALSGVTSIGPGESVVFIESAAGANVAAFRTFWGQLEAVQVGFYSGSGVGLSSGGDGVNIFDGGGTLINGVSFGSAVQGVSFGYDPSTLTFGAPSVVGVNGARMAAGGNEIGSPGAIPAPSAVALLIAGGIVAGRRRR